MSGVLTGPPPTSAAVPDVLPAQSRAIVIEAPRRMVQQSFPLRAAAERLPGAWLKVEIVGICGTDLKLYTGALSGLFPYPLIMGHEIVGRIVRAEESWLDERQLTLGARVVVEPVVGCGVCANCESAQTYFCDNAIGLGLRTSCDRPPHLWGGLSEYLYLPPRASVYAISDAIPPERAVMVGGGIANGIQWVQDIGDVRAGERVAILGAGPQGLCCAAAAADAGASQIVVSGVTGDEERLRASRLFGVTTTVLLDASAAADPGVAAAQLLAAFGGRPPDLVVDASGSPAAVHTSLQLVRPLGRVVQASMIGSPVAQVDVDKLAQKQVSWHGVRGSGPAANRRAVSVVERGRWPFERLITRTAPLSQAPVLLQDLVEGTTPRPVKAAVRVDNEETDQ